MFGLETISPKMLDYYVGHRRALIIDLRSAREYEASHIKGAVNMPYETTKNWKQLPKDKELILYCQRGSLSLVIGRELAKNGYQVRSVIGGIGAYKGKYQQT